MLSPATFQPFLQRHFAGDMFPQRHVAGEKIGMLLGKASNVVVPAASSSPVLPTRVTLYTPGKIPQAMS
ncbi:hypothetical protein Tco_1083180 [Tanacetum coccineum]|uniref:Uncharacterized protein n=1 Tax=Tanacetum coccineum TaxID=301880 RepID=A0ABQ5I3Z9_9ASTR